MGEKLKFTVEVDPAILGEYAGTHEIEKVDFPKDGDRYIAYAGELDTPIVCTWENGSTLAPRIILRKKIKHKWPEHLRLQDDIRYLWLNESNRYLLASDTEPFFEQCYWKGFKTLFVIPVKLETVYPNGIPSIKDSLIRRDQ